MVYMDNSGRIWFGVYTGSSQTLNSSAAYNDGQWHQIVAGMGPGGMTLFVDGKRIGQRADVTAGQPYSGYRRIGGDNLGSWPSQPSSNHFAGDIDEVALYAAPLSLSQVQNHYTASGRSLNLPKAPADSYGAAVFGADPELFWRLGESTGTTAADAGPARTTGTYSSGITLGENGAVADSANTAALFNGSSAVAVSNTAVNNPTVYTEELWFKTTTTNGGKLIGFGNASSGLSSGYDRHVYMENG
ncbi:MAG: domain containing protein, partial [Micrococcaceae bacterium]|nr:domain containing protein [Micrococcaceae bacterium]